MTELRSPAQLPDFQRYWLSRFAATLATNGMIVIIGYQLYDLARSQYGLPIGTASFLLGLLGLAQFLPLFLLTPLAGLVADRFERRRVAALAMGIDLTIAAALAIVTWRGGATLTLLFVLGGFHGAARVFVGPAMSAIAPNIVTANLLPNAIAMSSLAWQIGAVAGPVLAGFLYARNPAWPYFLALALMVASIGFLLTVRPVPAPESGTNTHPLQSIREGFAYVRDNRFLLGCVTLDLFAVLLGGATALLPVFARDILHVGPEGLGLMRAAPGLGAALVGFYLAARPISDQVGIKMLAGVVIYGAATLGFALSRNIALSLLFLVLVGAGDMVSVFIRNSLVQLATPNAMRGRVQSISGLAISASNELGEMQSGLAAALLGATGAVALGGVGAIIITLAWAAIFPELRKVRNFTTEYL